MLIGTITIGSDTIQVEACSVASVDTDDLRQRIRDTILCYIANGTDEPPIPAYYTPEKADGREQVRRKVGEFYCGWDRFHEDLQAAMANDPSATLDKVRADAAAVFARDVVFAIFTDPQVFGEFVNAIYFGGDVLAV